MVVLDVAVDSPALGPAVADRLAEVLDGQLRQVRGALLADPGSDAGRTAALGARLVALTAQRDRLRRHTTTLRYRALARIHAGHERLRAAATVAELLPAAARELGGCCGFDRTAVFGVTGAGWRLQAHWSAPDAGAAGVPLVDVRLLRRRAAVLVDPTSVVAPVLVGGRVVGALQAGCATPDRRLTEVDRANMASFAAGFSLVYERTALLERLHRWRLDLRDAFATVDHQLAGTGGGGTRLVRGGYRPATPRRYRRPGASALDHLLTAREQQVVELMAQGASNRYIGDRLVITEETVKSHVRSIAHKLRASGRADAVAAYLRLRLRDP